jgi:hypothetical protein
MTWSRRHRAAWWALVGVALLGNVVSAPYAGALQNWSLIIPMTGYLVVGALVARRRPDNAIGWVFLSVAAVAGVVGATNALSMFAFTQVSASASLADVPWWGVAAAWLYSLVWFPLLILMTTVTFLLFPSGLPSRGWRWVMWLAVAPTALASVLGALAPTFDLGNTSPSAAPDQRLTLANPIAPPASAAVSAAITTTFVTIFVALVFASVVLSVSSLFIRRRHASPVERLQLRWFALAATLVLISFPLQYVVPGGTDGVPANIIFTLAVAFVPVACGIAILRYRLYDIDRIVSRTASYAIVTAVVAGLYGLIVTSVSRLLPSDASSLAVAAATLTAAALVRPLLTRVQRVVDRRFNRERVDGQRAVEAFGAQLANEVDPDHARDELLAVARRMLAPSSSSLWLVER